VQSVTWDIEVFDSQSGIQGGKLHTNLWGMLGLYALLAPALVEFFEPFVFEGLDHSSSVARCATLVKMSNGSYQRPPDGVAGWRYDCMRLLGRRSTTTLQVREHFACKKIGILERR
jgi:hypothetical protein